ncbi:MAG: hypothetical protein K5886_11335, partial [Lachnospiraceae bacterium]|nr:hypothetical protein [Lachnospiraceae bacterium]
MCTSRASRVSTVTVERPSKFGGSYLKRTDGEIISADSMQVYRHLNIGSAKITDSEMCGIKHHLID